MFRIFLNITLPAIYSLLLFTGATVTAFGQDKQIPKAIDRKIDFAKEVAPILERHCADCHGEDTQESNLRVDSKASLLRGGDLGEPAIIPGKGAESFLVQVVAGVHDDVSMPPEGDRLTTSEISILRTWIDQGVEWPGQTGIAKITSDHWSFQKLVRPNIPDVKGDWAENAIDHFIHQALESKGLTPSMRAEPLELLRRLRLVNHGLPPTIEQMQQYKTQDSYSDLVNEILKSPHFGERWAAHWLDLVRFGETTGYEVNRERPNAFHYRDFVIESFNTDKPYDQFVREQIAGDQVGNDIGTGFLVAGPNDLVKSSDVNLTMMQRQDELADYINATSTTFLGLTVGCARCHNHKFDAITQRDYYAMQAIFSGVRHGDRALTPSPEMLEREKFVEDEIRRLEAELLKYIEIPMHSMISIDDASEGAIGVRGFEVLQAKTGTGKNPDGTGRGHISDAGDSERLPNISGGTYSWWGQKLTGDLARYHLMAKGEFRIWLSWGTGPKSHADDVQYVLDRDGDLESTDDQTVIATVDQLKFADGSRPAEQAPLWSGVYNAGVYALTPAATILVRRGEHQGAVTTDLVLLERASLDDESKPMRPALREAVTSKLNREVFTATTAKFVRMTILQSSSSQPCLDEFSIFAGKENVGLAADGAVASASSNLPGYKIHQIKHLNDGLFGNEHSWISNESGKGWAQIELTEPKEITSVEWARDRTGNFTDRVPIQYRIEVSLNEEDWTVVASDQDRVPFKTQIKIEPRYDLSSLPPQDRKAVEAEVNQLAELKREHEQLRSRTLAYAGTFTTPTEIRRLYRGDFTAPREVVGPDALEVFGTLGLAAGASDGERRLAFANWVASKENPLTARVIVNRIWQFHFGTGIVDTPSDLGKAGTLPSHPELLDFLASELMENGWSLKHIHRLIMESATYQQSSRPRREAIAVDAGARLLWRFPPRRMEAEVIRDSILHVSGALDTRRGGPGFPGFEVEAENVRHYFPLTEFGPEHWRRMIYMTKVRQEKDSIFGVFDCPDASQVVDKRSRSTTALQALNLFNSGFVIQQCKILSDRLKQQYPDAVDEQVRYTMLTAFGRNPGKEEVEDAVLFVKDAGLVQFCRAIFNANEFVFVN